jgi:hypothetical protein
MGRGDRQTLLTLFTYENAHASHPFSIAVPSFKERSRPFLPTN